MSDEEYKRPTTVKELIKDRLERHVREKEINELYMQREGVTSVCRGCLTEISPDLEIPFCDNCSWDNIDTIYYLCEEIIRLSSQSVNQ